MVDHSSGDILNIAFYMTLRNAGLTERGSGPFVVVCEIVPNVTVDQIKMPEMAWFLETR